MREAEREADRVRGGLKTRADAEAYVESVRAKINKILGPWPDKTPLNARVTGTVERDGYTIEKVVFESRPGFPVTANLYLPKGQKRPVPGVLGLCGHSANGKAAEPYQSFSQGLARKGYAVLTIDPVGQGERLQYVDGDMEPTVGTGVLEHNLMGNQLLLTGDSLSGWFAWDGIRALDYLLSRPEVDPKHIGVTGISGGGTQTSLLCGVDTRITMAAPGCYTTTWRRNLENEEAADSEQCPPGAIAEGLDHSDFLVAMAPRPVIMLAQERDFFDVRGTIEAFGRVKHVYRLLGAEENVACFVGSGYHGYAQELREAMYGWFNRFTGSATGHLEPPLTLEDDKTLQCTPQGQVNALGTKTVAAFTRDRAASLAGRRTVPSEAELKKRVLGCLKLPAGGGVPDYRILRNMGGRSYPSKHAVHYAVETEAGVFALLYLLRDEVHYSRLPTQQGPAILYVADRSSDSELRAEPLIKELFTRYPGTTFYACDVRGIGESEPNTTSRGFDTPYGSDYFYASYGLMLDYPYAGQRTHDLLQVIRLLGSAGHTGIHLVGKGWGAIPATFAALLSDKITQVTLKNALTAYGDVARRDFYDWPLSAFLPGVLAHFDLPDCYAALERKGLTQIAPCPASYPGGKR
ncbi:alpha/beta hydrolase family protein [Parapedobacter soli]|uniref:alpha/beta hydrolase family protein n=1 Tax=Parapedobacter soli TaxID=416955 RepID=UPI0021C94EAC|nr:alpha/beta hydrolase family protein [Parapedobacter soli]